MPAKQAKRTVSYSYNRQLGIFYVQYHKDMIIHSTACESKHAALTRQVCIILVDALPFCKGSGIQHNGQHLRLSSELSRFEPSMIRLFQKGGILPACYQLIPTIADNWFSKGRAMCNHVYLIINVKDPWLSVVRVGHHVPLVGFCLVLYDLHVLNRDVNMIPKNNKHQPFQKHTLAVNAGLTTCPLNSV